MTIGRWSYGYRLENTAGSGKNSMRSQNSAVRDTFRGHCAPSRCWQVSSSNVNYPPNPKTLRDKHVSRSISVPIRPPQVEATKFTEVGFHGRDVDQIIRDLVENAISLIRQKTRRTAGPKLKEEVDNKILEALCGAHADPRTVQEFRALLNEGKLDT